MDIHTKSFEGNNVVTFSLMMGNTRRTRRPPPTEGSSRPFALCRNPEVTENSRPRRTPRRQVCGDK